ncbi:MAG: hypothetical protein AB7I35_14000 [Ramlibacter sp.]
MSFSSTVQILKVDAPEEIKLPTGRTFMAHSAQCALLTDEGAVDKVGRLRIPDSLVDKVAVGLFRCSFGLEVAQWGKQKGDIVAVLTDLHAAPQRSRSASPSPAPATA